MITAVWSVTHNMHPSGKLETIVFPADQAAWVCWAQLINEAWDRWFGLDPKLYPGSDTAALILDAIPGMPHQVRKTKH